MSFSHCSVQSTELTCKRGGRGGETHVHFSSSSIIWKALSSINQSCMHYTWLSVHPSTHTHTSQNPQKPTEALTHISKTMIKWKVHEEFFFSLSSWPVYVPFDNMCSILKANMTSPSSQLPAFILFEMKAHHMVKLHLTNHTLHRMIITTDRLISH